MCVPRLALAESVCRDRGNRTKAVKPNGQSGLKAWIPLAKPDPQRSEDPKNPLQDLVCNLERMSEASKMFLSVSTIELRRAHPIVGSSRDLGAQGGASIRTTI